MTELEKKLLAENENLRHALIGLSWTDAPGKCWCTVRGGNSNMHMDSCIAARKALENHNDKVLHSSGF